MAGRGPAPKPPGRKAGHSRDPHGTTTIEFAPAVAPSLPSGIDWHPMTVAWWDTLRSSPLAGAMMAVDWSFMLDTALLHHQYWNGDAKLAAEIRLRVAKLGVTPEDRLRLRIQAVAADEADAKRPPVAQGSRDRFAALRAVPTA